MQEAHKKFSLFIEIFFFLKKETIGDESRLFTYFEPREVMGNFTMLMTYLLRYSVEHLRSDFEIIC